MVVSIIFPLVNCLSFFGNKETLGKVFYFKFTLDADLDIEMWRQPNPSPFYHLGISLKGEDTHDSQYLSLGGQGPWSFKSSFSVREMPVFP